VPLNARVCWPQPGARVVIRRFPEPLLIFDNDALDVQEFGPGNAVTADQNYGIDPKLRAVALSFDMHVGAVLHRQLTGRKTDSVRPSESSAPG
jgi:hypothetical protein